MKLTSELKALYIETAKTLSGSHRRLFLARAVKSLGRGGQRLAEAQLGWDRKTIRKGTHELLTGIRCHDNFKARGRKPAEDHLPNLLSDIETIVSAQCQTNATFATDRLYTRLSAAEVRRQLISQNGYTSQQLPSEETIRVKLNSLGYRLRSVEKSRPQKKFHRPMQSLTN